MWIALAVFAGTYLVLAIGFLPYFRVDRTGAAIIGATLMIAFNVLTVEEAYRAIDYNTLILLFGMMIVVANRRLSGFFRAVAAWVVEHARRPLPLLAAIVVVSGVLSAFFVNDTICLVMTPLVLEVTLTLNRNPVPYLLAIAMGANVGSAATITGNPQNMMIGAISGVSYRTFAATLAPVAVVGLLLTILVIATVYWKEFRVGTPVDVPYPRVRINRVLLAKSLVVSVAMIVLFFLHWPVPVVALLAGALLLITRRVKPEKVYHEIDWALLVMFVGLFIVVAGVEKAVLTHEAVVAVSRLHLERTGVLSVAAALLSNLVSNVPAVLVFRPFINHLADPERAWMTLAMASTLAGNLTLLGSVANLIVVQRARSHIKISFVEYLRAGVPLTVLTLAAGVWWLR